jgi:indole-3-glycerol phosphate synthase
MNILNKIIEAKKVEVQARKKSVSIQDLTKKTPFNADCFSFKDFLLNKDKTGIITEFKRQSPSRGIINNTADVKKVTADYAKFGASAISVLTDETFFGGTLIDLEIARLQQIPILRKDFIVDEYQLFESKAYGADIILLIAACLTVEEVKQLALIAKNLGLNVLLEIHTESELAHICNEVDVVGINNRNLKDFKVDIHHSIKLGDQIPKDKIKIAESGIHNMQTLKHLKEHGFQGFLMGEIFMKEKDPGEAFRDFILQS